MPEQTIELIGIEGLGTTVDPLEIAKQQTLEALTRLPKEKQLSILKQLPEDIMAEICNQGIKAELGKYAPTAISFIIVALIMYGYVTDEILIIGLVAGAVAAGIHWIVNDTLFQSQPQTA